MREWIYQEDGKYYRELTDLVGTPVLKEEISEEEYLSYKD